jgi:hypothetical protein
VDKHQNFCRPVTVTLQVYISTEIKPSFSTKENECGVNISTYTPEGMSSEHSFLLHDQHPGDGEEWLLYMDAVVFHFMAKKVTCLFAATFAA